MTRIIRSLLLVLPMLGPALVTFELTPREAFAQGRNEEDDGGRGEGRRGRGRFFGGDFEGGRGGRGRFRDEEGGRRFGRGGGDSERGRGEGRDGERRDRLQRSDSSSDSNRSERSSGGGSSLNMEGYVRRLVQERDKNGDMMLQADEQRGLTGKAATADLDKDGVITTNELVTALSDSSSGSTSGDRERRPDRLGGRGESTRSGSGSSNAATTTRVYLAIPPGGKDKDGKVDEKNALRTYRFLKGADRLPATGLPSWFKSRDKNGDGQVEMSEYSRTWSDRTVNEFRRYDLDNDGIVTAKEATSR